MFVKNLAQDEPKKKLSNISMTLAQTKSGIPDSFRMVPVPAIFLSRSLTRRWNSRNRANPSRMARWRRWNGGGHQTTVYWLAVWWRAWAIRRALASNELRVYPYVIPANQPEQSTARTFNKMPIGQQRFPTWFWKIILCSMARSTTVLRSSHCSSRCQTPRGGSDPRGHEKAINFW